MNIYTNGTISFSYKSVGNELHMIHEIDDEDFGLKSEVHYILSHDMITKLFSIISEKDFIELCRKEGLDGMLNFFESHDIPYRIG